MGLVQISYSLVLPSTVQQSRVRIWKRILQSYRKGSSRSKIPDRLATSRCSSRAHHVPKTSANGAKILRCPQLHPSGYTKLKFPASGLDVSTDRESARTTCVKKGETYLAH